MKDYVEDILCKIVTGEASVEELQFIEGWKSESANNLELYNEYTQVWNAAGDYTPTSFTPNATKAYEKHLSILNEEAVTSSSTNEVETPVVPIGTPKAKIFSIKRLSRIAAIFAIALAALFVFDNYNTNVISADSGLQYVSLDDGSHIWLEEGSSLSYKKGFGTNHRNIKLNGKAFFDVQRNESVPFNIQSDNFEVSVLGTSFTVDESFVAVKTGKVSVQSSNDEKIITANQKVNISSDNLVQSDVEASDINWRNPDLSFDNAPMSQVVSDINLYHDSKIILNNQLETNACNFTAGGLKDASFDDIVEILKRSYDLEVEESGDNVTLTITDCK